VPGVWCGPGRRSCRLAFLSCPRDEDLDERLGEVLAALYLMFNEGYLTSRGNTSARRDLAEDAAWLTVSLALYPENRGIRAARADALHLARSDARSVPRES